MEICDRIKEIRTSGKNKDGKKYTTREFAEKIGITAGAVTALEKGRNTPGEQTIRAICSEFGVNRLWLTDGVGDMYVEPMTDDLLIEEALSQRSEFIRAAFKAITKTPGGWEMLEQLAENIQKEMQKKDPEK